MEISRDVVTQPGYTMKMVGDGMPIHQKSGDFGDLFVSFKVKFPTELSERQKESMFVSLKFIIFILLNIIN